MGFLEILKTFYHANVTGKLEFDLKTFRPLVQICHGYIC